MHLKQKLKIYLNIYHFQHLWKEEVQFYHLIIALRSKLLRYSIEIIQKGRDICTYIHVLCTCVDRYNAFGLCFLSSNVYSACVKEGFSCNCIGLRDVFSTVSSHNDAFGDWQH